MIFNTAQSKRPFIPLGSFASDRSLYIAAYSGFQYQVTSFEPEQSSWWVCDMFSMKPLCWCIQMGKTQVCRTVHVLYPSTAAAKRHNQIYQELMLGFTSADIGPHNPSHQLCKIHSVCLVHYMESHCHILLKGLGSCGSSHSDLKILLQEYMPKQQTSAFHTSHSAYLHLALTNLGTSWTLCFIGRSRWCF